MGLEEALARAGFGLRAIGLCSASLAPIALARRRTAPSARPTVCSPSGSTDLGLCIRFASESVIPEIDTEPSRWVVPLSTAQFAPHRAARGRRRRARRPPHRSPAHRAAKNARTHAADAAAAYSSLVRSSLHPLATNRTKQRNALSRPASDGLRATSRPPPPCFRQRRRTGSAISRPAMQHLVRARPTRARARRTAPPPPSTRLTRGRHRLHAVCSRSRRATCASRTREHPPQEPARRVPRRDHLVRDRPRRRGAARPPAARAPRRARSSFPRARARPRDAPFE